MVGVTFSQMIAFGAAGVFLSSVAGYVAGEKGRSAFFWFSVSAIPTLFLVFWEGLAWLAVVLPLIAMVALRFLPSKWTTEAADKEAAVDGEASVSYRKCPYCAEAIRKEAVKCRHCQSDLEGRA